MDQKSQKNLSPELKAIYDRVMNTKVSSRPQTPTAQPQQAAQPSNNPSAKPILKTEIISNTPLPAAPPQTENPAPQQAQHAPETTSQPSAIPEPQPSNAPDLSPIEAPSDQSGPFLSSLPPRPLNSMSDQPFVFTGGKTTSTPPKETPQPDQKNETPQTDAKGGNRLSSKIIIGLLVVFLVVYSLFWAKIFNIF